jgi:hypothetical protein
MMSDRGLDMNKTRYFSTPHELFNHMLTSTSAVNLAEGTVTTFLTQTAEQKRTAFVALETARSA